MADGYFHAVCTKRCFFNQSICRIDGHNIWLRIGLKNTDSQVALSLNKDVQLFLKVSRTSLTKTGLLQRLLLQGKAIESTYVQYI